MRRTLDRDRTCGRIREMCEEKGISVDFISSEMNVSRQTVYSWFSLKKMPSIDHLIELSDILGVPVDDLIVKKIYISGG